MAVVLSRDFRDLRVWEASHRLAVAVYAVTKTFPREEMYGLTSQIRRAATSIPANIAEGCGRGGGDLVRFCRIAAGSAMELDYHFLLARDVGLLQPADYDALSVDVMKVRQMIGRFIVTLSADE